MLRFESPHAPYLPKERQRLRRWLAAVAAGYRQRCREVTYRFLTDDEVLEVNREYLDHDFYTDIITFDNRDEPGHGPIEADIVISVERVRENAATYHAPYEHELRRVLAHGLLHLCGLKDKTKAQAAQMREAEEAALTLWDTTL